MEDMRWQLLLGLAQCPAAPSGERGGGIEKRGWRGGGAGNCAPRAMRPLSCSLKTLIRNFFFFADASFSCL